MFICPDCKDKFDTEDQLLEHIIYYKAKFEEKNF